MPIPDDAVQTPNLDQATVDGFGDEWSRFDQTTLAPGEHLALFNQYFHIFPWTALAPDAAGVDVGCGSGRWARHVAPKVGRLYLVDASPLALGVAARALCDTDNTFLHVASAGQLPFASDSLDFGYSLGVLHHLPDTASALRECVRCLKKDAPFLLYLYYAFDNRPSWYRWLWRASDVIRRVVSIMPMTLRYGLSQAVAGLVYWPLARFARLASRTGLDTTSWPLVYYADRSFYTMRTDALDRFGTQLEQRFSRAEVTAMMHGAGLWDIVFSSTPPFWCAVGFKRTAAGTRT